MTHSYPANTGISAPSLKAARILIIEDNPDHARLFECFLAESGAKVTQRATGLTGLTEILRAGQDQEPYHLIVLDVTLPDLSGIEVTRNIRSRRINTPIVAVTARAMSGDREICLEAGCSNYLSKPLRKDQLLQACREALKAPPASARGHAA